MGKVRNNSIGWGPNFTSAQRQSSWTSLFNWIRDATVDKVRMTQYTRASLAAVSMSLCNHDACLMWTWKSSRYKLNWNSLQQQFEMVVLIVRVCSRTDWESKMQIKFTVCMQPNQFNLLDGTCLYRLLQQNLPWFTTSIAKLRDDLWVRCLGHNDGLVLSIS